MYWRLYDNPAHAREGIAEFQTRYNRSRPHWALIPVDGGDPLTPHDVYVRNGAEITSRFGGPPSGHRNTDGESVGELFCLRL